MNELITVVGGPENLPYVVGAIALIITLAAVFWLTGGKQQEGEEVSADQQVESQTAVAEKAQDTTVEPEPEP
ncbi:MAG: hypothetical protein OQJ91_18165, partial [Motiliproteus sp.]|nr:hypothetical protein [Motiliproteus sp.]